MIMDPPYGIRSDSEWRDRAGLNGCGPAEASYMKNRDTRAIPKTTHLIRHTRADWSEAFALVPSLQVAYVWHASCSRAKCSMGCCGSDFCTPSRSSGTRAVRCSLAPTIGTRMNPVGTCARRTRLVR